MVAEVWLLAADGSESDVCHPLVRVAAFRVFDDRGSCARSAVLLSHRIYPSCGCAEDHAVSVPVVIPRCMETMIAVAEVDEREMVPACWTQLR